MGRRFLLNIPIRTYCSETSKKVKKAFKCLKAKIKAFSRSVVRKVDRFVIFRGVVCPEQQSNWRRDGF